MILWEVCLMKMLKRVSLKIISLLILTLTPSLVLAQIDHRSEVFINLVHGKLLDDETNLGSGFGYGLGYAYRVNRRWSIVLEGATNDHLRDRSGESFKFEGYVALVGGGLQYHFRPLTKVEPYFRFGVNAAHYYGTITRKTTIPPPGIERNGSQYLAGPDIGVGIKIYVNKRISIRPEYRFAINSGFRDYDPTRDIIEPGLWVSRVSIGIGYHW